jgi:putative ABC transport system substrate-binding protein
VTTRRELLIACGAGSLMVPLACFAQQQRVTVARVAVLEATSASTYKNLREALTAGLREHGYVEGRNIAIEYRWAEGKYERLPGLAAELVKMRVDVIVAASTPAIQAAQRATTTIPIVMVRNADPVGMGFVASLSRPGGNITGLSNINVDVVGKYVELLRTAVPKLGVVGALVNPAHPNHPKYLKRLQAMEKTSGIRILPARAATEKELDAVFAAMMNERPGALIVLSDSFFFLSAQKIANLAVQHRLPTMFWTREPVESGGLMSYGQNVEEHYYRAATFIDKILKGAKPADLPVEQPTKLELVINLKTAKSIGLSIPQELLFRADKLIE